MKQLYIIGSGAIGKALAVFLRLQNRDVTIIRGSVNDGSDGMEHIQVLLPDQSVLEADLRISTLNHFSRLDGTIVLANKSYGNNGLAHALKEKTGASPLVLLQNGLGVEKAFIDTGFPNIYRCVLFTTSQSMPSGQIRFKPVAHSLIGTIRGESHHLDSIVEQLDNPVFRFRAEHDIQPIIWKKAIANSVFNSICPLLNVDNGIFHRDEQVLELAKRIINECVAVAREEGILLDANEVVNSLLMISRSSDGQLISTLQDINNRRPTEIATLNLEIAGIAAKLGKEELVKETRLLGELTKLKSELSLQLK